MDAAQPDGGRAPEQHGRHDARAPPGARAALLLLLQLEHSLTSCDFSYPASLRVPRHRQDNPYTVNVGVYYVRGRPHNAFFFQIVHRYLEAFPTTFDQALINCLLKKVGTTRRLSFLFSRDNCEADGINASHPALAPVLRMKGAWEYGALDPNHVLSHATPCVAREAFRAVGDYAEPLPSFSLQGT